jgi:hypothetical protein
MTLDRVDESPNTNCLEGWQSPDCQSWGSFTVEVTMHVRLSDDGTDFLENYGDTEFSNDAPAMCQNCQREATVAYFRQEGA